MPQPNLFIDSSALFAGVVSSRGAARALLLLAESEHLTITVSEQVVAETERALTRKVPQALPYYREALRSTRLRIVHDPSREEIEAHSDVIAHQPDVPIVVAAMNAGVDCLVTLPGPYAVSSERGQNHQAVGTGRESTNSSDTYPSGPVRKR